MFRETFARLGTGLNEIAKAIKAKIGHAICQCMPSLPAFAGINEIIVVTGSTNALNAGKSTVGVILAKTLGMKLSTPISRYRK
jgi:hypothetical protein